MTESTTKDQAQGNWLFRLGCSCLGTIGCAVIVILLVAFALAGGTLLLVTAPPLEYISQLSTFLETYSILTLIAVIALVLLIGGGGGYMAGGWFARWQAGTGKD